MPERLRLDNGHPWGSAHDLPAELALWMVGLGVGPAWNPPRQPWLNPKVERANGVTQRWVEIGTCPDHATLEERLAWACRLQRERYPAVEGRSRIEAYPELTTILRPYSVAAEEGLWSLDRVDAFLAGRYWKRRADRYGTIWLYNRSHCLGRARAGQDVLVQFAPASRRWIASDATDTPIKSFIAEELSRERILALDVGRRRCREKKSPGPGNP